MIKEPYTLFSRIILYRDTDGTYYTDLLWEHDLKAHLTYITDFRICCPVEPLRANVGDVTQIIGLCDEKVIPLRQDRGWGSVIGNVVPNFWQVRRAVKSTRIAHSGGAGWAFPLSYYLRLLRWFYSFQWIIVIESSFWMKPKMGPVSLRRRLSHHLHIAMLRSCVRQATARIFTQDGYRQIFLGHHDGALVAPAVWVNEDQILDHPPMNPTGSPLRLVFPARLVASKGVGTVLAAVIQIEERLRGSDTPLPRIDIVGSGPLEDICRTFCANRPDTQMQFLDPVPYGEPFLRLIRAYDAVIVANEQDEQPRIVFDAYSQALPVIGTRTIGMLDILFEGETGYGFEIGDAASAARIVCDLAADPSALQNMRANALAFARNHTHASMHQIREEFLQRTLGLGEDRVVDSHEVLA